MILHGITVELISMLNFIRRLMLVLVLTGTGLSFFMRQVLVSSMVLSMATACDLRLLALRPTILLRVFMVELWPMEKIPWQPTHTIPILPGYLHKTVRKPTPVYTSIGLRLRG